MFTNQQIIGFLKRYSLLCLFLVLFIWGSYKFTQVDQKDLISKCDLGGLKVGEVVDYQGANAIIIGNDNYGGHIWVKAQSTDE